MNPEWAQLLRAITQNVRAYFQRIDPRPQEGRCRISGVDYLLLRTEGLVSAAKEIGRLFGERMVRLALYTLAREMARLDARDLLSRFQVTDPLERILYGPLTFAFSGIGRVYLVRFDPEMKEGWLLDWLSPDSVYVDYAGPSPLPVCEFLAGYSAGWCSESLGVELATKEIYCRAQGRSHCRFLIARPSRLEELSREERFTREVDLSQAVPVIPTV